MSVMDVTLPPLWFNINHRLITKFRILSVRNLYYCERILHKIFLLNERG